MTYRIEIIQISFKNTSNGAPTRNFTHTDTTSARQPTVTHNNLRDYNDGNFFELMLLFQQNNNENNANINNSETKTSKMAWHLRNIV